ncbi:hypothetical protein [Paraburkholderia tagetis]|uniref:Uncharacterized protein n=1 Tax=Paraburkholderia tagetis TaxID=2913261 RepID=A0A9X1UD59_9BURK|nr:hypothetical protein [Paraburkholderia tagetis]MCG5072279.1 hypothetical protein [Paraburkholderia tagetis]
MAKTQSDAAEEQPVNTLGYSLIVRHAFDQYRKGDMIRDQAEIERVLGGLNQHNVHKVVG